MFFFFYNAHNFSFRITLSFLWWFSWFSISTASCPSLHFFASATCSWRHSQVKIRMARAEQYISISFTNDIAICCYVNGMIFTKVNTDFVSSHVVLNNPFFDYDQMWCTGDNACVYYRLAPCVQLPACSTLAELLLFCWLKCSLSGQIDSLALLCVIKYVFLTNFLLSSCFSNWHHKWQSLVPSYLIWKMEFFI